MKLLRIATLTFDRPLDATSTIALEFGNVKLTCKPATVHGKPSDRRIAIAEMELANGISIDADGYILVPDEPRRACENAIESLANIIAVFNRCGRQISSATPWVALCDLQDAERSTLNASKGFRSPQSRTLAVQWSLDLTDPKLIRALADRLPGVALLAEASSTKHSVACYRELIRFLEHAFARPLNQLEKKLSQFLISGDLGYTRVEVHDWVAPRHGAIHGDRQESEDLVMERDVRRFLPRMEQAAYDVLFNKTVWHDASQTRRPTLRHYAAITSAHTTDIRLTQGHGYGPIKAQILDPFDAYPLNLEGILNPPPRDWWYQPPKPSPAVA
jgi:hypothetical protein